MSEAGSFVSINPANAVQGGGQFDDVDVTIKQVRTTLWDYNGKIPSPVVALAVTFEHAEGGEFVQHYSAGDPKNFVPSEDGHRFVPVGSAVGLNENTNAMAFLVSFINSGFPGDKVTDDVTVFEGTRVHVQNIPQPKRPGLAQPTGKNLVLVVNKIHSLPWETSTAPKTLPKPKAATAPKVGNAAGPVQGQAPSVTPAQTEESGGQDELMAKATEGMLAIVSAKGGMIPKAQIAQEAFKLFSKDPQRNQLVALIYNDVFLAQPGAPWTFDGTTVKLG